MGGLGEEAFCCLGCESALDDVLLFKLISEGLEKFLILVLNHPPI